MSCSFRSTASLPQKPAQFPSDWIALLATNSVEGDCQNIPCRALKSWLLANSISLPNFDFIALRVAASSGSFLTAGADATAPAERAEAVRVTRSVLYMQEFPFRCLARVMTTPVAFVDWYELPTSIGRRRHPGRFSLHIRVARS